MAILQKKVCLLGEFAVGKTSLVRRFVEGNFEDKYLSTIGTKISRKKVILEHNNQQTNMMMLLWDLAGGEKFDRMMSNYYRGAAGAVLVCDVTRMDTVTVLKRYAQDFWSVNPNTPLVIVGNKIDLVDDRVVQDKDIAQVAAALSAPHYTSSAKTGIHVEALFNALGTRIISS